MEGDSAKMGWRQPGKALAKKKQELTLRSSDAGTSEEGAREGRGGKEGEKKRASLDEDSDGKSLS